MVGDMVMVCEVQQVLFLRSFFTIVQSDVCQHCMQCLKKWGFRRCEDICWIKTNIKNPGHNKNLEPKAIFQRTKVCCCVWWLDADVYLVTWLARVW